MAFSLLTADAGWGGTREACGFVSDGTYLYRMGGLDDNSGDYYDDIWKSTDGVTWTQVTVNGSHWSARAHFFAGYADNKLWVYGGLTTGGTPLYDIWYSSDGGVNWTQETDQTVTTPQYYYSEYGRNIGAQSFQGGNFFFVQDGNASAFVDLHTWDGSSWTRTTDVGTAIGNGVQSLIPFKIGATYFLYVLTDESLPSDWKVYSSADAITFTAINSHPPFRASNIVGFTPRANCDWVLPLGVYNSRFYMIGEWYKDGGASNEMRIASTADGITWAYHNTDWDATEFNTDVLGPGGFNLSSSRPAFTIHGSSLFYHGQNNDADSSQIWGAAIPAADDGSTLEAPDNDETNVTDCTPEGSAYNTTTPTNDFDKALALDLKNGRAYPMDRMPFACTLRYSADCARVGKLSDHIIAGDVSGYISKVYEDQAYARGPMTPIIALPVESATSTTATIDLYTANIDGLPVEYATSGDLKGMDLVLVHSDGTEEVRTISSNTAFVITVTSAWTTNPVEGEIIFLAPIEAHVEFEDIHTNQPTAITHVSMDVHETDGGGSRQEAGGNGRRPYTYEVSIYTNAADETEVDTSTPAIGPVEITKAKLRRYFSGMYPLRTKPAFANRVRVAWRGEFGRQEIRQINVWDNAQETEEGRS